MTDYQVRYAIVQRRDNDDSLVSLAEAARLTGMSTAAIRRCCAEGLVQPVSWAEGVLEFDAAGLGRLRSIARLRTDLGLSLASVEIVLHLRDQMHDLQRQMDALRRQHLQREDELLATIHDLRRRFAADGSWWE